MENVPADNPDRLLARECCTDCSRPTDSGHADLVSRDTHASRDSYYDGSSYVHRSARSQQDVRTVAVFSGQNARATKL